MPQTLIYMTAHFPDTRKYRTYGTLGTDCTFLYHDIAKNTTP
jgi:hypothetical protein